MRYLRAAGRAGCLVPEVLFASVPPGWALLSLRARRGGRLQIPIQKFEGTDPFCMEMNPGTVSLRIGAPPADSNVCSLV